MEKKTWQRDEVVDAQVSAMTLDGQGVARSDGMVIFVRDAVPGDVARVRLTKIKKSFAEGVATAIIQPSEWRVVPRCRHFGECGGCASQNLSYDQQMALKSQGIRENLAHLGGLTVDVRPALGMAEPWFYRNKMEFAFGEKDGRLYLGLMERGSYDQVVETTECFLATPRAMQAVRLVEAFCRETGLHAWDPRLRKGSLRNLVVRQGMRTGDLMLNLISTSAAAILPALAEALAPVSPTTVLWTHNDTWGSVVRADKVRILSGTGEIHEQINHLTLRVGPFSFLQTNSAMVEVLYGEITRQADLKGGERVLDLYCGAGSIGLCLARQAAHIVGIDSVPEAIEIADLNATDNGIVNAEFQCAAVEALSTLSFGAINPDLIILDPPRAGLHPRLLENLREQAAERMIYVSCNPAALARDLKALSDLYDIGPVQPVDMFPHTWHIESVVTLQKKVQPQDVTQALPSLLAPALMPDS